MSSKSIQCTIDVVLECIYSPLRSDIGKFLDRINVLLGHIKITKKYVDITGDIDISLIEYRKNADVTNFVNMLHSYLLFPLINKPTRGQSTSKTIIDNTFCNFPPISEHKLILMEDIIDHFPIF